MIHVIEKKVDVKTMAQNLSCVYNLFQTRTSFTDFPEKEIFKIHVSIVCHM